MTTPWNLFWGLMFSAIGLGFFTYGRKQQVVPPLVVGLVLMVLPWFITSTGWMVAAGAALTAVPWFMRR
jgi:hypothetical protein